MINRHVPLTLAQPAPTEEKGRRLPHPQSGWATGAAHRFCFYGDGRSHFVGSLRY